MNLNISVYNLGSTTNIQNHVNGYSNTNQEAQTTTQAISILEDHPKEPKNALHTRRMKNKTRPHGQAMQGRPAKRAKFTATQEIAHATNDLFSNLVSIQEDVKEILTKLDSDFKETLPELIPIDALKKVGFEISKVKERIQIGRLFKKTNVNEKIKRIRILLDLVNPYPYSDEIMEREEVLFAKITKVLNRLEKKPTSKTETKLKGLRSQFHFEKRPECVYSYAAGMSVQASSQIELLKIEIEKFRAGGNLPGIQNNWNAIINLVFFDLKRFGKAAAIYREIEGCYFSNATQKAIAACYRSMGDYKIQCLKDFPLDRKKSIVEGACQDYDKAIQKYDVVKKYEVVYEQGATDIQYTIDYLKGIVKDLERGIMPQETIQPLNAIIVNDHQIITCQKGLNEDDLEELSFEIDLNLPFPKVISNIPDKEADQIHEEETLFGEVEELRKTQSLESGTRKNTQGTVELEDKLFDDYLFSFVGQKQSGNEQKRQLLKMSHSSNAPVPMDINSPVALETIEIICISSDSASEEDIAPRNFIPPTSISEVPQIHMGH